MITKADIESLFATQLEQIQDAELRAKVAEAWVEGCKLGGYGDVAQLKKMPFTLLTETHGINFIEHTIAVTEGAVGLAKAQQAAYAKVPYAIDMDRLVAGGLLHDLGKLMEIEQDGQGGFRKSHNGMCTRHPISGAILAAKLGFSDEILNCIGCHASEGNGRPQVVETVLIHQADFGTFNPLVMMEKGHLIEDEPSGEEPEDGAE